MNNPVSNEVDVLINNINDMKEGNSVIYGVIDNTVVTLSSINEFDGRKDWLSAQIA